MKILFFALIFMTVGGGCAMADAVQPLLPSDSRIKLLEYSDEDVYTITTKYGYQTNIVFGLDEEIQTISVGDRSLWQLIPSGNRLFIRPMVEGAQTNMTLITNKHSYQFDLKSLADGKGSNNIYVARFVYPEDQPKHPVKNAAAWSAPAQPTPAPFAAAVAPAPIKPAPTLVPTPLLAPAPAQPAPAASPVAGPVASQPLYPNYNYTYAGSDEAAPAQAYDDGKTTFIQYRNNQALPSVYMIDAGGNKKSVSYYVEDNLMVIGMVAGEWQLESNAGTVTLYNEMMNPQ